MPARKGVGIRSPEPLDNRQSLAEPIDAASRIGQRDAGLGVLRQVITGTDSELQPPTGKYVDRCRLPGQQRRMTEIVAVEDAADPQCSRRARDRDQARTDREPPLLEVVRDQKGVVPQPLGTPGLLLEPGQIRRRQAATGEAERSVRCHHRLPSRAAFSPFGPQDAYVDHVMPPRVARCQR